MTEIETEIHSERQDKINGEYQPGTSKKVILDRVKNFRHKLNFRNLKKLVSKRNIKIAITLSFLFLIGIPIFTYLYFARDLTDKNSIMNRNNAGVKLLDDKGELFFAFYNPKNIEPISLEQIPKLAQQAAIASEDKGFYTNPGFSPRGIARAFIENIKNVSIDQGGSTITQQLVKNSLLSLDRNFLRKYQEIILSLEIERRFSKDDILEMYLNSIYFGEGAFGIENAAQEYFGKSAKNLDLAESSILVAILPAPSAFSPRTGNFDSAKKRQEIVLTKMQEQGFISQTQKNQAMTQKLDIIPAKPDDTNTIAPHFALMVKDYLIKEYGEEKITRSGYIVKTTLNRKWQEAAQKTVLNQVNRLTKNKASNGAAVVLDPKTADIKALVGSKEWANEEFGKLNMALAPRQPGSSFKPIIYARAIDERQITPQTIIKDEPVSFGSYKPKNYDGKFRGDITAKKALANSLNIPAVKVMNMVGVKDGIDMAKKLGITSLDDKKDYGLPLVLGAAEVPLLEMTNAYATLANRGKYNKPNFVLEIKDKKDKVIEKKKEDTKNVVGEGVSFLIATMLSDPAARADVFGGSLNTSRNAAVKTGTTEDYKDALTVGFTPNIAIGVWVGNNDNKPMDRVAGASGAAPIFVTLMNLLSADVAKEEFSIPSTVIERGPCQATAPSPSPTASPLPQSGKEYYLRGTEPPECAVPSPTPSASSTPSPEPTPVVQPSPTPAPSPSPASSPIPTILPSILPSPSP